MSDPVSIEQKSFNPFVVPTDVNAQQKSVEIVSSELNADVELQAASNKKYCKIRLHKSSNCQQNKLVSHT